MPSPQYVHSVGVPGALHSPGESCPLPKHLLFTSQVSFNPLQIPSPHPTGIIVGGGVGTHLPKFHEHLHEELELYRSPMILKMPQIMQAQHPEEAVNYGGYLLAKQLTKHA